MPGPCLRWNPPRLPDPTRLPVRHILESHRDGSARLQRRSRRETHQPTRTGASRVGRPGGELRLSGPRADSSTQDRTLGRSPAISCFPKGSGARTGLVTPATVRPLSHPRRVGDLLGSSTNTQTPGARGEPGSEGRASGANHPCRWASTNQRYLSISREMPVHRSAVPASPSAVNESMALRMAEPNCESAAARRST